jgi:hypothetical protein
MAAISQKLPNLVGGVSQQPDTVKYSNQLRSCDNYYPDFTAGLAKRPGLQAKNKLANAVDDGTWFHVFRDDKEKYIFQFSKAGAFKVWDANSGLQQTVNTVAAESTAYAVHDSFDDLATLQINDYIFILNRTKIVKEAAATSSAYSPFGFVNINTVAFNTDYVITIDGINFSHTTPSNASGSTQNSVQTIINALVSSINGNAAYTSQGIGNTIFIRRVNNGDFSLRATGGTTGTAVEAFKEIVTSVSQLPREFLSDRRIKIEGTAESNADDYWVKFIPSTAGQSFGVGHWEETIAPNTTLGMDISTLPHVVIREANGTFTYRQLDEASATASAGTSVVTGIPTSVSILTTSSGGHVVGEEFAASGGTGSNLRLRVDKVKTVTVANSYAANSSSYVEQVKITTYTTLRQPQVTRFIPQTTIEYHWYFSGNRIGTGNSDRLVIGNTIYTRNSDFQNINNQLRAGISTTEIVYGVIDAISIVQYGQNYTALNPVYNANGDSFRVDGVNTQNLEGDEVRLQYWKQRTVGAYDTNPMPSFVNNTIDGISFFKNRMIFTSRHNVICSQAGDYFNFFASTVITIVDSDPIDLSASSSKPIQFKHLLPVPRGLLLFGDNAQYILETTTEAFAPKTAEVNLLSAFSQSDAISPIDIGPSYIFIEEGDKATSVYEMNIGDNVGGKPAVQELTRPIPYYIPAAINNLKVSQSANTFGLLSRQDLKSIYLYRFFNAGDNRVSAWFRWILPGTVESFDFDQDIMYIVTKQNGSYLLSTVSLLTETPSQSLLFEDEYLDVRLDLFDYNPAVIYKLNTDTTRICFKDGFNNSEEQAVVMFLDPDIAGSSEEQTIQYDASAPTGQKYYLEVDGNKTAAGGACTVERTGGSTLATVTCQFPHRLTTGNTITVLAGVAVGNYVVTVLTDKTFRITTVATTAIVFTKFVFSCVNTTSKFALGYKYEAIAELPAFYFVKGEGNKDTLNIPRINRLKVNSYNSGPYRALVTSEGREDFSLILPQINANNYKSNNIPVIRNAESTVPIMAKGNQFSFKLIADSPFPTAFTSLTWEGTYNNKGIQVL